MYDKCGYRKDSMDRFGDDLTELIVSYLWFEDKVRLECVSKQWRRYVYQKQFTIEFSYSSHNNLRTLVVNTKDTGPRYMRTSEKIFKRKELESLLNKCPNITKVIILLKYIKNNELSLFGQYCPRLKSLGFEINSEEDLQFGRQYGHKLEELHLFGTNEKIHFLKLCPNVKNVWFSQCSLPFTSDKEFLPKLEYFGRNFTINIGNTNEMKILSDKYSQTMKTLNVTLNRCTFVDLKIFFHSISRFGNLRGLRLTLYETTQPIDYCLSLIGQKCTKLFQLHLTLGRSVPISDRLLNTFSEFKKINALTIYSSNNTEVNASIESLKHCKQLKHLDFGYLRLTENFFTNINIFLPKLQFINFSSKKEFSASFINSFHPMKDIQRIIFRVYNSLDNKCYIKYWYFGKCLSEVMLSSNGMNVKRINDNCGVFINK